MHESSEGASDTAYEDVLEFLYTNLPMYQRVGASAFRKDLTNTLALCDYLGNPERSFKSIHIAGTNGKGSSSHYLAAILQKAGYKTGLYTSPHLKSFTERIRLNGIMVPRDFVVEFVTKHRDFIEQLKPSFFEITVGMAFDYFAREKVDLAVIEVGMGGRLDSTNVILPEVCLITNISLDHQQWLGNTLPEIAGEKAGIIKDHTPVVISEQQEELWPVFQQIADQKHAPLIPAYTSWSLRREGEQWVVWRDDREYFRIPAKGVPTYQQQNLPGVLQIIQVLNDRGYTISREAVREGIIGMITLTGLKGRWQRLSEHPLVICDVGHNTAGVKHMLQQLDYLSFDRLFIIWGMVSDKDITPVLRLLPTTAHYFFSQASIPRALDAETLARRASEHGLNGEVIPEVNTALQRARHLAGRDDLILIGGSNFLVAELNEL